MNYVKEILNRANSKPFLFLLNLEKYRFLEITDDFFPSIAQVINWELKKQISEIEKYPELLNSITHKISNNIFNILKIPLVYSANIQYKNHNKDFFYLSEKELLFTTFNLYRECERIVNIRIGSSINYFKMFFLNLEISKENIRHIFQINGSPIEINWPLGDFHHNGNTHTKIIFSCGKSLMYKTKDFTSIDVFESFISNLTKKGYFIPYFSIKRLKKDNHYFEEFVEYCPVNSVKKIDDFYITMGKYLAFFYILGISDIIKDNVIAYNGIPVFLDVECIFKPTLKNSVNDILPEMEDIFKESVIGTGILPFLTPNNANDPCINFATIGSKRFFEYSTKLTINNNGQLCIYQDKKELRSNHLPSETILRSAQEYCSLLIKGFKDAAEFILQNKEWLLEQIVYILGKSSCTSRLLLRHTNIYSILLNESLHPDLLISSKKRWEFLKYLEQTYDPDCFPMQLIQIEKEHLYNMDIPLFQYNPENLFVKHKQDNIILFKETGTEATTRRINSFDSSILNFQISLIEKSIACIDKIDNNALNEVNNNKYLSKYYYTNENIINCSKLIGDKIIDDSLEIIDGFQWIDISIGRSGQWEVVIKKPGIYDGFDGIGLFYLYLYISTGNEKYKQISEYLLKISLKSFSNFNPEKSFYLFSPYNYPFSSLYFIWHFQELLNVHIIDIDEIFKNKVIPFVKKNIYEDVNLDVVNGSAGLLVFLLNYYTYTNATYIEECVHLIKNYLIDISIKEQNEIYWNSYKFKGLIGFAHGNAGFLFALSKFHETFGYNKNDIDFIHKVINKIQNNYDSTNKSWLDLRYKKKTIAPPSWCHGSSGILLSYVNSYTFLKKTGVDLRIPYLIESSDLIKNNYTNTSHCLCHGLFGNALILNEINLKDTLTEIINKANNQLITEVNRYSINHQWKTGFTNGKFSLNGLFLGTSGIGYALLKIFINNNIPSVLTLESPKKYIL
ncbi:MAG: hypothetical protein Kow0079_13950 [Vicingaceae bacterium]